MANFMVLYQLRERDHKPKVKGYYTPEHHYVEKVAQVFPLTLLGLKTLHTQVRVGFSHKICTFKDAEIPSDAVLLEMCETRISAGQASDLKWSK